MATLIILLFVHLMGDFFFQSDWMATNKSKDWLALGYHASIYSLCFIMFGFWFYVVTFVTHFITDAITSRITSKLWFIDLKPFKTRVWWNKEKKGDPQHFDYVANVKGDLRHWFFVVIGIDQFIHACTLALTYNFLIK